MAASQTGAIRSRRRSLLVTSVPAGAIVVILDSKSRVSDPIPPIQLRHMAMGLCSFQIAIHV